MMIDLDRLRRALVAVANEDFATAIAIYPEPAQMMGEAIAVLDELEALRATAIRRTETTDGDH